ncbi:hypothetical protein P7C70_g1191, partial [Phenoliferia sp. Uapishka_3]
MAAPPNGHEKEGSGTSSEASAASPTTASPPFTRLPKLGPNNASWSYLAILALFRYVTGPEELSLSLWKTRAVIGVNWVLMMPAVSATQAGPQGLLLECRCRGFRKHHTRRRSVYPLQQPCQLVDRCASDGYNHTTEQAVGSSTSLPHFVYFASMASQKRKHLRLTAKDTQFGRGTFTSWLIESAGTLPIRRPKDHLGQKVDNSIVFAKLIDSLESGDIVCMFPEGLSRYFPELAPLKQGVARIVSDVLSRQKDNPNFELAIQTCSITYLHRNLFRSDVLVTFHPPIKVSATLYPGLVGTPTTVADYEAVRRLTSTMGREIRSGTLDAPSWTYIRTANTARRLYAPLGTRLGLGDHVRLTQRFVDAFAGKKAVKGWSEGVDPKRALMTPMVEKGSSQNGYFDGEEEVQGATEEEGPHSADELDDLARDLKTYQVSRLSSKLRGLADITGITEYPPNDYPNPEEEIPPPRE